jgi:formylmethanofuran dehydrogenase subunit B
MAHGGGVMPSASVDRIASSATCLGCGCTCDDITLVIRNERIAETRNACPLGAQWFGDGATPGKILSQGTDASIDQALDGVAALLTTSKRALVYLAPDLTCEAQRLATALADVTRSVLDTVTSTTAADSILAAQSLGRAGATLGEVRNAADVLIFWGVDPSDRYPRFATRYAPEPAGLRVPDGRASRKVVAVDVGSDRGPVDADVRVAIERHDEIAALSVLASIAERMKIAPTLDEIAATVAAETTMRAGADGAARDVARQLAPVLAQAKYAVIVADAEGISSPGRAEALIRMSQIFNGPTRCALIILRGGGNRTGADAVVTGHTGYPLAVDFRQGYPRYLPYEHAEDRLARGDADAVVVIGSAARLPANVLSQVSAVRHAVIGPRASESALAAGVAAIDTAIPGIHEEGTVLRLDDVPLPVRAAVNGPMPAASVIERLLARVADTSRAAGLVRPGAKT